MIRKAVVLLVGVALIVVAWFVAVRPVGDERLRAKLHTSADGDVIKVVALDDVYTRLTVSWYDKSGVTHTSRFDTDTDNWHAGEAFYVLYDAERPTRRALSGDPYYTNNGALRTDARVQGGTLATAGLLIALTPTVLWGRRRWARRSLAHSEVLSFDLLGLPVGPPYAWDDRQVREKWKRYGGWAPVFLWLGVAGTVVVALMLVLVRQNDAGLLKHGADVQGQVLAGGGHGSKWTQSWVRVRYTDEAGKVHVGDLHGPSPDDLSAGTAVEVVYDKHDPARFRTRGYANHSDLTDDAMFFVPTVTGLMFVGSAWVFFTALWGRRLMRRQPWVPARVVAVDLGSLVQTRYFELVLQVPGEPRVRARLGSASRNATDGFTLRKGDLAQICAGSGRRFLINGHGLTRPYVAMLPRSAEQSRRWARVAQ